MSKPKDQIGLVAIEQRDGTTIFVAPAQARQLAIRMLILADEAECERIKQPSGDVHA